MYGNTKTKTEINNQEKADRHPKLENKPTAKTNPETPPAG
jgi:hypothetical protein